MQVKKPCLLLEFGFQQQHPSILQCDNQSATKISEDSVQRQCNKDIELHMHFIKKLINDHILEVLYLPMDDQVIDIFAKQLIEAMFFKLQSMLEVHKFVIKEV